MKKVMIIILLLIVSFIINVPVIKDVRAVGLAADQGILGIEQRGWLPEKITVDGSSETIYKGAALAWSEATDTIVAKLTASSTDVPAFVGMAAQGSTSATGIIQSYYSFYMKDKTIYGDPEIGKSVYLKTRSDYLSDDFFVVNGEVAALTVGTSCTFTNGSKDVTGVGTSFTTELNVGDDIYGLTDGVTYKQTIDAITSDTALTIDTNYGGTGGADTGAYAVYVSDLTTNSTETYGGTAYYNMPVGNIAGYASTGWVIHVSRELVPLSGSASGTNLALTGNLTVGGTTGITGNTTVGGTFGSTGLITATAYIESDEIDAESAGAMIIGKANATSIEIADTGVTTDIQGDVTVEGDVDTAGSDTMTIGAVNASKVEFANTGVETEVQGNLDVHEDANFVTGVIAGVKDLVTSGCQQVVAIDSFPWNDITETEAAAAFAKVYDESATAYLNLSGSIAGGGYASDYQLFPDTAAENDAVYFGSAAKFGCIDTDVSATAATYGADSITWEYWDGSAWSGLTIIHDYTDSTAQDGLQPFQQDGHIIWSAPSDWDAVEVDSQSAYWVRARCNATVNITQIPLFDSHEHYVTSIDNGTQIPYDCVISRGRFNFGTASSGTADTKILLYNYTTATWSAIKTLTKAKKDPTVADFALTVNADDVIGFYIVQVDGGGVEYTNGICELTVTRN